MPDIKELATLARPMDYERLLLSKAAQTGRVQTLLATGVRDDHFEDEELQKIYRFMADHVRMYRSAPSFKTVKNEFPDHYFELTEDSVEFLKDRFLEQVQRRYAINALRDLAAALDDPSLAGQMDSLFLEKSRELAQLVPSAALHKFSDMEKRIEQYETGESFKGGIRMGIPLFDDLTQGIQPHEYISIVGWQGTGKSTLAQWILFNAWMQGETPMYISLEMEAKALLRKWDTMLMNFEYNKLKSGELRDEDIERWKKRAVEVSQKPNDIVILDDVRGCTVDRVYGELERWRPTICCIDYVSLMDVQRGQGNQLWEKVTYLTQSLKQVARTTKIPIIGVAQTNINSASEGADLSNISYSRSIGQDSDLVLGLHSNDEMRAERRMEVRMLKNRDGMTTTTDLLWDMQTMTFGPWRESMAWHGRKQSEDSSS